MRMLNPPHPVKMDTLMRMQLSYDIIRMRGRERKLGIDPYRSEEPSGSAGAGE